MNPITRVIHPLVDHHLCVVRNTETKPSEFRAAIGRLAMFLGVRATEDLQTEAVTIRTPLADAPSHRLAVKIGIVPILRAGLGMVDPLMVLLPDSQVWHLGLYRDEATAEPISYYDKLPSGGAPDVALVLDPMLATGGSIELSVRRLRSWGVRDIRIVCIIASQQGVDRIAKLGDDVKVFVAAIDPTLNEQSYIVPGLGDAGDRLFDTLR